MDKELSTNMQAGLAATEVPESAYNPLLYKIMESNLFIRPLLVLGRLGRMATASNIKEAMAIAHDGSDIIERTLQEFSDQEFIDTFWQVIDQAQRVRFNNCLIAAAPDLLKALEDLLYIHDHGYDLRHHPEIEKAARLAIAKAGGR